MSFFDRWAKLKREAEAARAAEAAKAADAGADPGAAGMAAEGPVATPAGGVAPDVTAGAEVAAVPQAAREPGEAPPLPSLEDVVPGGDLRAFFGEHVPEALRQAAMRRMWAADPAIRDFVSEACDYAWDWNVPGGAPGCGPIDPSEIGDFVARLFGDPAAPEAAKPAEPAAMAAADTPDLSRDHTPQGTDHTVEHVHLDDGAAQQTAPDARTITEDVAEAPEMERFSGAARPLESTAWAKAGGSAGEAMPVLQARRHGGALPR